MTNKYESTTNKYEWMYERTTKSTKVTTEKYETNELKGQEIRPFIILSMKKVLLIPDSISTSSEVCRLGYFCFLIIVIFQCNFPYFHSISKYQRNSV